MEPVQTGKPENLARASFGDGFGAPLGLLVIFVLFILRGVLLLPEGYNGKDGLNDTFLLLFLLWLLGTTVRWKQPASRLASGVVAVSMFAAVTLCASLAAASNAIGGGDYVDPWLQSIDNRLFPFFDWKRVAIELPKHAEFYWILNLSYDSLAWQPLFFIAISVLFGQVRDLSAFVTAWALGLLICVAPFHWFPALSPIPYHGIDQSDLPGHWVSLPWRFLPIMEGMRDGTITSLGSASLTGMVTFPSFHACGATIMIWAFWRHRLLRWPFATINILMMIAAVPIGSHYIIDILAGIAAGTLAAAGANALSRRALRLPTAAMGSTAGLRAA